VTQDDDLLDLSTLDLPDVGGVQEVSRKRVKPKGRDPIGHEKLRGDDGLPTGEVRFFLRQSGEELGYARTATRFTNTKRPFELTGFSGVTGTLRQLKQFLWERLG